MKAKAYYSEGSLSAAFYDVVTAADVRLRGDEAIYASLAPPGGSVLELGAGTGRLTAALAARGLDVLGVDIAPAMLAQAQARIAALPEEVAQRITLACADMTTFSTGRRFDLVMCPFFTLAHVPVGAGWSRTFAVTARHLRAGGLAAFHLPRLEIMRRPGPVDARRPVLELPLPDGGSLMLFVRERSFREGVNRMDQLLEYTLADARRRVLRSSLERQTFYMTDPRPLAEAAGLTLERPPIDLGGIGDVWVFRKG